MKDAQLADNELWMASFYRSSEMSGANFFGRVARTVRGPLQKDLTHHYADEAMHSFYWTAAIDELEQRAIPMRDAYQDRYLDAVGVPSNLMEVLAITQILEKRTIGHYNHHLRQGTSPGPVNAAIEKIMVDERWHIQYVREALAGMEERYGAEEIESTITRFTAADIQVYAEATAEWAERMTEYADHMARQRERLN